MRKGVEARRTRSVGRVQRLQALRAQRAARRESLGRVRLEADAGIPSGKIVAELKHVSMRFPAPAGRPASESRLIVKDFSATILRGDKVGLIGPNGAGKTTLLKLILGELQPTSGSVRQGARLEVAYFDQMRSALDLDATLADSVSPGSEWVETASGRKHVMSYLSDFLFSPARANSPLRTLSGGERNRVLLARLLALPANVLVLDEPTNDLDIDTLELLEELLQSYAGHGLSRQPRPPFPRQRRHQHDRLGRRRRARRSGASTKAATRTGSCRRHAPRAARRGGAGRRGACIERRAARQRAPTRIDRRAARLRLPGRPPPRSRASSATRNSASSMRCRRASRRSRSSRRSSPRCSPAPSSTPRTRFAPRRRRCAMRRSTTSCSPRSSAGRRSARP